MRIPELYHGISGDDSAQTDFSAELERSMRSHEMVMALDKNKILAEPAVTPGMCRCSFEQFPGAASRVLPPTYRLRAPHKTLLHRIVHQHLETMLAEAAAGETAASS